MSNIQVNKIRTKVGCDLLAIKKEINIFRQQYRKQPEDTTNTHGSGNSKGNVNVHVSGKMLINTAGKVSGSQ